jgi:ABC-type transporter Mla subunit MlaD
MSAMGYIVGKIISSDKTLAAHVASDEAIFERLFVSIKDLKDDVKDQSAKLDRLIEQNLNRANDAMAARGAVSAAAATALDVVESAKVQAMAIIAHAASEAKKVANNV